MIARRGKILPYLNNQAGPLSESECGRVASALTGLSIVVDGGAEEVSIVKTVLSALRYDR